jgi:hypothetical protein
MKEGLIVYLIGGQEIPEPFDLNGNCRQLGLPAHQVELVGKSQGFFSVDDAWHFLLTRGVGPVAARHLAARPPARTVMWLSTAVIF